MSILSEAIEPAWDFESITYKYYKNMKQQYIWVLLEAGETREVIATLDEKTIERLAEMFYNEMEDEEDDFAPKSVAYVKKKIIEDVCRGYEHHGYFLTHELYRQEINVTVSGDVLYEDADFEVKSGNVVYEATQRIVMGCDMAYALSPIGYFSRRVENPMLEGAEWVERRLL